jgi:hypothetical protein
MGRQRFYNLAQMIILVSNTTLTVESGRFNEFAAKVINYDVIATNSSFYNAREGNEFCAPISMSAGSERGRLTQSGIILRILWVRAAGRISL